MTIKTEAGVTPRTAATEKVNDNNRSLPASEIRVADLISEVKDNTGDLVKYFPDTMLSAEQVEAKQKAIAKDEERIGDMRYEYAVEQGNETTVQNMLLEKAEKNGYIKDHKGQVYRNNTGNEKSASATYDDAGELIPQSDLMIICRILAILGTGKRMFRKPGCRSRRPRI